MVGSLAKYGEDHNNKQLTGLGYLLHLFPYFFEQRTIDPCPLLVSDRDPIIDTLCYSDFYLPPSLSQSLRPSLKVFLETVFNYPRVFIYLDVSPEVSLMRGNGKKQLHDRIKDLSRLKELFEKEMFESKKRCLDIIRIDTNTKPLEQVIDEVEFSLQNI